MLNEFLDKLKLYFDTLRNDSRRLTRIQARAVVVKIDRHDEHLVVTLRNQSGIKEFQIVAYNPAAHAWVREGMVVVYDISRIPTHKHQGIPFGFIDYRTR